MQLLLRRKSNFVHKMRILRSLTFYPQKSYGEAYANSLDRVPFQSTTHWLHEWLLAGWGLPIGELFDLENLAAECNKQKKWTFFFSSMPLKVSFHPFLEIQN
jgi:hypothetical protein